MITIREIEEADSISFLSLTRQLDTETRFMLLEPGERTTTPDDQLDTIRSILSRDNQTILVAEHANKLVGYVAALGGSHRRNGHKATIVAGITKDYVGMGLGTRMFKLLEAWALRQGLHRLELTVMAHNARAVALYKKMGFVVEGISVDSLIVDGRFVDELDMAKILGDP